MIIVILGVACGIGGRLVQLDDSVGQTLSPYCKRELCMKVAELREGHFNGRR